MNGYELISDLDTFFRISPEFISKFSKDILKYPFISYIYFHILFISFDVLGGELPDERAVNLNASCVVCLKQFCMFIVS